MADGLRCALPAHHVRGQTHARSRAFAGYRAVNRVFRDKPGGLVVDYIGLPNELRDALATYTASGGKGRTAIDQSGAVAVMLEKYEGCLGLFHGFDWSKWVTGTPEEHLALLAAAREHILRQDNGKERLLKAVAGLSKAFALAVAHEEALRVRDDVGFFQAVRSVLAKGAPGERKPEEELDHAIRQIVSRALRRKRWLTSSPPQV